MDVGRGAVGLQNRDGIEQFAEQEPHLGARQHPAEAVPMHIRNAPTGLMKELGYGSGYQYAHNAPEAYIPQEYLPEVLRGSRFYEPGPFGFEKEIAKRLAWWEELRRRSSEESE